MRRTAKIKGLITIPHGKMSRDGKVGKRYADVLVKVHLKDGSVRCIFIHIEVQGQKDVNLPERTYVYNYRIYDHHRELNE